MNYLDLFSGIGGFALGAYWAGWRFDEHYFSEIDKYAIRVYQRRFPEAVNLGDITKIVEKSLLTGLASEQIERKSKETETNTTGPSSAYWIITGGFPCQDISCAGKGEGIQGRRSGLWFAMRDVIRLLRPRYAIIENVGAITNRGLDVVLSTLAEIGYDAEWQDIRASDVGAPHRRERIWIVAYPNATGQRERWRTEPIREAQHTAKYGSQDVADTRAQGLSDGNAGTNRQRTYIKSSGESSGRTGTTWAAEPDVGRVAHGVRNRVDRLKCLGNSIVPQIAEILFRRIREIEYGRQT